MGLFAWIKSLFRRTSIVRNVAGLGADSTSSDAGEASETIDLSGGPLKPGHRRRALRDRRLLPKPPVKLNVWPRPKRVKHFAKSEANRLFSTTMRTRNRQLRDLATDPEQLERYGLPVWNTEADVAEALGISVGLLRHFSIHRVREKTPHYVTFAIPKRSGGERLIHAPKRRLKAILRDLQRLLVSRLPVSPAAHGFRPGRSVASNAAPHVGQPLVMKFDLQDCFPSIHIGRVRGMLIALGYSYPIATTLAVLMTEAPRQPVEIDGELYHAPVGPRSCVQGAPTSPGLCNAVLRRLDRRLNGFARRHGFVYTRYADDLTFSGADATKIKLVVTMVGRIVREEGFRLNRKKTRVLRQSSRQRVTGVVVNRAAGLSRRERRRLRAELHQLSHSSTPLDARQLRRLAGKLAYLRMLNPAQAEPLEAKLRQLRSESGKSWFG